MPRYGLIAILILMALAACEPTATPSPPALSTLPGIATPSVIAPTPDAAIASQTPINAAPTEPIIAFTPTSGVIGPLLGPEVAFLEGDQPAPAEFTPNPDPTFPAGTSQITVIIPYFDMLAGMPIRREWYRGGELWLSIEDTWRGAAGDGLTALVLEGQQGALESGEYELRLFINDTPQGAPQRFRIEAPAAEVTPVPPAADLRGIRIAEPEGDRAAVVHDWGTVSIESANGSRRPIFSAHWITGMAWFPDGQHLVVIDRLPERAAQHPADAPTQLYIVDVQSGDALLIGRADEYFSHPEVNADGNMVLVMGGTGSSTDCLFDESVGVIRLDSELNRIEVTSLNNFAGMPPYDSGGVNVVSVPHWVGPSAFQVELYFNCTEGAHNGIYQLDALVRHASQVAVNEGAADQNISPTFSQIIFSATPEAGASYSGQATFPFGTARVYALIRYENMRDGMIVRREWYQDGKLWVEREEEWDIFKYGADGLLSDVSIFSQGGALPVGTYEVRLFIDGIPQFDVFTGFETRSFVIVPSPEN